MLAAGSSGFGQREERAFSASDIMLLGCDGYVVGGMLHSMVCYVMLSYAVRCTADGSDRSIGGSCRRCGIDRGFSTVLGG